MKFLTGGLFFLVLINNLIASDFPLRSKFPSVPFISTEDLNKEYTTINIVDVRSKFEFDVIHIKKAVHIPLPKEGEEAGFVQKIGGLKGMAIKTLLFMMTGFLSGLKNIRLNLCY